MAEARLAPQINWLASREAPLLLALMLSAIAYSFAFAFAAPGESVALLASRYTARVSFPLFLVAYLASSLVRLVPNEATRAILRRRRQWGLAFALAHTIHLIALGYYNIVIQNMPGLQSLLGGGLAYGLMFAMAFTSNDASMRAMGKWWKRLHTVGIHWIWFVFAFSYFGRIFDPGRMGQGLALFPIALGALGLRLYAKRRRA